MSIGSDARSNESFAVTSNKNAMSSEVKKVCEEVQIASSCMMVEVK